MGKFAKEQNCAEICFWQSVYIPDQSMAVPYELSEGRQTGAVQQSRRADHQAFCDGAKELADGTKKFEEEGTSKLKSTFEDDLGDVLDRIQALNSDKCAYTSYSGKANGMDGSVKFIIETAAIEAAEE